MNDTYDRLGRHLFKIIADYTSGIDRQYLLSHAEIMDGILIVENNMIDEMKKFKTTYSYTSYHFTYLVLAARFCDCEMLDLINYYSKSDFALILSHSFTSFNFKLYPPLRLITYANKIDIPETTFMISASEYCNIAAVEWYINKIGVPGGYTTSQMSIMGGGRDRMRFVRRLIELRLTINYKKMLIAAIVYNDIESAEFAYPHVADNVVEETVSRYKLCRSNLITSLKKKLQISHNNT